jgi:hypothetical protein
MGFTFAATSICIGATDVAKLLLVRGGFRLFAPHWSTETAVVQIGKKHAPARARVLVRKLVLILDAFPPYEAGQGLLAASLNNLGNRLHDLGRP